jgi:uncharacterized protein YdeI (YjbR/CyaY-like superfamily)
MIYNMSITMCASSGEGTAHAFRNTWEMNFMRIGQDTKGIIRSSTYRKTTNSKLKEQKIQKNGP